MHVYHNYVYICPKIVQEKKTVTDICRERERESVELTEAKALPSASPVCELPVGFPRFVAAKKNIVRGFVKVIETNGNWSQDTIQLFNC